MFGGEDVQVLDKFLPVVDVAKHMPGHNQGQVRSVMLDCHGIPGMIGGIVIKDGGQAWNPAILGDLGEVLGWVYPVNTGTFGFQKLQEPTVIAANLHH